MFDFHSLQELVDTKIVHRNLLSSEAEKISERIEQLEHHVDLLTKARFVLAEVTRLTQAQLKGYIESLVTLAIQSVYDEDLRFVVEFDYKRNKAEVSFWVKEGEDGEMFIPKDEMGGGLVDVISFALRVVLWSLQRPESRPVLILDEPFPAAGVLTNRCGEMVKEISDKLELQIVLVTHNPDLIEIADRVWRVEKVDGKSLVIRLGP